MIWNFLTPFICGATAPNSSQIKSTTASETMEEKPPTLTFIMSSYLLNFLNIQVSLFIDSLIGCTVSVPPTKFEEIAQK